MSCESYTSYIRHCNSWQLNLLFEDLQTALRYTYTYICAKTLNHYCRAVRYRRWIFNLLKAKGREAQQLPRSFNIYPAGLRFGVRPMKPALVRWHFKNSPALSLMTRWVLSLGCYLHSGEKCAARSWRRSLANLTRWCVPRALQNSDE